MVERVLSRIVFVRIRSENRGVLLDQHVRGLPPHEIIAILLILLLLLVRGLFFILSDFNCVNPFIDRHTIYFVGSESERSKYRHTGTSSRVQHDLIATCTI